MFSARYQDAIDTFEKYVPISTYPAEKHRALCDEADCYSSMGNIDKATETLLKAIEFIPAYVDPYVKLGVAAYCKEDWADCVEWMNEAIAHLGSIHPLFPLASYNTYLPYDYISIAYSKLGEIEKAYVCELRVFKFLPNDKRISENITYFENALGLT